MLCSCKGFLWSDSSASQSLKIRWHSRRWITQCILNTAHTSCVLNIQPIIDTSHRTLFPTHAHVKLHMCEVSTALTFFYCTSANLQKQQFWSCWSGCLTLLQSHAWEHKSKFHLCMKRPLFFLSSTMRLNSKLQALMRKEFTSTLKLFALSVYACKAVGLKQQSRSCTHYL